MKRRGQLLQAGERPAGEGARGLVGETVGSGGEGSGEGRGTADSSIR